MFKVSKPKKDVQGILVSLNAVNQIYEQVNQLGDAFSTESQLLQALLSADNGLIQLQQQLSCALVDELPNHIRDGGIFRAGYSTELDELCHSFVDVRNWMQALEPQLRQSLDIKSLKIGFNKVFGYYIEVPNSQKDKIPSDFIRKQTTYKCRTLHYTGTKRKRNHSIEWKVSTNNVGTTVIR